MLVNSFSGAKGMWLFFFFNVVYALDSSFLLCFVYSCFITVAAHLKSKLKPLSTFLYFLLLAMMNVFYKSN